MVRRRADRGFALLLALAVLLLVASAVLLAFRTARAGAESLQRERRLVELRAATDAALAATLAELDEHASSPGVPERRLGNARISSAVELLGENRLAITATARIGGDEMVLGAVVRVDPETGVRILSWNRSGLHPVPPGATSRLR